ncbi:hypothetical protein ACFL3I_03120, partial [Pseudomonadota bacterium]
SADRNSVKIIGNVICMVQGPVEVIHLLSQTQAPFCRDKCKPYGVQFVTRDLQKRTTRKCYAQITGNSVVRK